MHYVDRWNANASWHPMDAKGVQLHVLVFRADEATLRREICDRYLNEPLGQAGRFDPLLPFVFVSIAKVKSLRSLNEPFKGWGTDSEIEVGLWVPLKDGSFLRRGLDAFKWFAPYVFVNNPTAVQQGREIFGYEKEFAWFHPDFSRMPALPASVGVHAYGIQTFGRESSAGPVPVLTITGPSATDTHPWESFDDAAVWARDRLPRPAGLSPQAAELLPSLHGLLPPQGTVVFLKQVPDIADSSRASFQQVVQASITVTSRIRPGGGELFGYRMELPRCDSHPIARTLGLDPTNDALLGLWIEMDFRIERGGPLEP